MEHRLIIRNLGPIEQVDLTLKDFTVLTGPQASGKSTIAKAIFMFRRMKDEIYDLINRRRLNSEPIAKYSLLGELQWQMNRIFTSSYGPHTAKSPDMNIKYIWGSTSGGWSIHVEMKIQINEDVDRRKDLKILCSRPILELLSRLEKEWAGYGMGSLNDQERKSLREELNRFFHDEYTAVYLPAGRSVVSTLAEFFLNQYSQMSDIEKRTVDYCLQLYLNEVQGAKTSLRDGLVALDQYKTVKTAGAIELAKHIINQILKGEYKIDNRGYERLELSNGTFVPIHLASSGQQESLWILNLLYFHLVKNEPRFFIIEEPESHLYPDAQNKIMQYIALTHNTGHQMLITTHSPYVLGSLNNLLYAHQVSQKIPEEVERIMPREYWINKEKFMGLHVSHGTVRNAMEDGLFESSLIDEVSDVINDAFDRLNRLDMGQRGAL